MAKPVYEDDPADDTEEAAPVRGRGNPSVSVPAPEEAAEETPTGRGNPSVSVPAPAVKRTPMVTKEQLAASGLSLRDYLNKQQGLTRRGGSEKSTRMPARPGQEAPTYSNEGQNKPKAAESKVDLTSPMSALRSLTRGTRRGEDSGKIASRMGVNPNTLLPSRMAKGGSASSRADGIAQRGKTRGMMK